MRFHGIYQHDTKDCGVACLATVCSFYGLKVPLSLIRELEKVNMNGSSIYGICKAADILGIAADAFQGEIKELLYNINETKEISVPLIVHTIKDDFYHFMVIKKINTKFVWLFDPDRGNVKMKLDSFAKIWTGYFISFTLTSRFKEGNLKKGTYRNYFLLLQKYRKEFLKILGMSLLITGITILSTLMFQHIIDHFMIHPNFELMKEVNTIFAIVIGLYILRLGIYIFRGIVAAMLSRDMEKDFLEDFLENLLKVPLSYFDSRKNGEALERLNDIEHIKETLCTTIVNIILDLITAITSGIIILTKSPILFMITCIIISVYIVEVVCFNRVFYGTNREIAQNHGDILAIFKETIDGFTTIKSFAAEKFVKQENNEKIEKLVSSNYKNEKIAFLNRGLSLSIEAIGIIVIFWCGFFFSLKGLVTIGELLVVIILAQNMLIPVRSLIETQDKIQRFVVSIERLNDVVYENNDTDHEKTKISRYSDNAIEISNLFFSYGYSDETLKNINIKVKKGSKVAFVGKSGSGKTTLVNLLLGLRKTEEGEILICGEDINKIDSNSLHKKIAYVPQDIFLFSKTILDNLLLGRNEISEEQLEKIIYDCQLEEIINKKEDGLYTVLSENAHNLSAGERQRIGIARALLQKPDIIIFDEVTSNLDVITEKGIIDMIYRNCQDITCIFIAHRLHTIRKCDEVFVFDTGEIVEVGSANSLIRELEV
ncbi:peptidase domain-containing ABC transporter [Merdimonas faecis]|uniref:peptidase domain-containing ABC transporter n=1 Tax=Merdimonas faecis TaxID=1653435 RepID=UPI00086363D5|nr:peptidase domain-containing ABC transporter [Merdimonas faecis]